MTGYVEGPAGHAFTAFLAGLTPSLVQRDLRPKSKVERKRLAFMVQRRRVEDAVAVARMVFTDRQMQIAVESLERRSA